MRAYSTDLRQKIIDAYHRRQGTQRELAEVFGVSASFIEKLLQRYRATGEVAPKPHGGGRQLRLDAAPQARIAQWVEAQADLTLDELCSRTEQELGVTVSFATMSRLLQRLGLGRKKSRSTPANETRRESNRLG